MESGPAGPAGLRRRRWSRAAGLGLGLTAIVAAPVMGVGSASATPPFHHSGGGVIIADQFNNRVVEVDHSHHVVWSFGNGASKPGPHSVVGPNDVERVAFGLTLIAGTGTPAATDPSCTDPNGCPDNRVLLVSHSGRIVWQYGQNGGVAGAGPDQLNTPVQATALPNGHVLITDQANQRVIEVNALKQVVWQYGMSGVSGAGADQLNNPNSAELLPNGHVLIADESNNRVIEVTRAKQIVWSYGSPDDTTTLNGTAFASRLPDGHTLITDSGNNRVVEIDKAKHVVFTYATDNRPGSVAAPAPTRAVRLHNGHTLVSDQFNDQVIEIDKAGHIVFSQGKIDTDGSGTNRLNAPYDAKVVGDFTGLTNPFFFPLP